MTGAVIEAEDKILRAIEKSESNMRDQVEKTGEVLHKRIDKLTDRVDDSTKQANKTGERLAVVETLTQKLEEVSSHGERLATVEERIKRIFQWSGVGAGGIGIAAIIRSLFGGSPPPGTQ